MAFKGAPSLAATSNKTDLACKYWNIRTEIRKSWENRWQRWIRLPPTHPNNVSPQIRLRSFFLLSDPKNILQKCYRARWLFLKNQGVQGLIPRLAPMFFHKRQVHRWVCWAINLGWLLSDMDTPTCTFSLKWSLPNRSRSSLRKVAPNSISTPRPAPPYQCFCLHRRPQVLPDLLSRRPSRKSQDRLLTWLRESTCSRRLLRGTDLCNKKGKDPKGRESKPSRQQPSADRR